MGFYHTTENPCVMMRVYHKTKSCEYIIIHQDELYIASNTLQEILHIVKDKYKIKINPNNYQESDFPYDPGGTMICNRQYMEIHKKLHINIIYIKFHQFQALPTYQYLYIQETFYMKMESRYCIMGSINQNKQ